MNEPTRRRYETPHIIAPSPDSTRMRAAVERENDDAFDVAWSRARHGRSVSEASEGDGRRGTAARRASTLLTVNSDDDDEGGERKRYCCWKTSRLFPPKDVFLEQHCRADLLSVCDSDSETRGGDLRVEVMFNLECGSCPVEAARAMLREAGRRGSVSADVEAQDGVLRRLAWAVDEEDDVERRPFHEAFYTTRAIVVPCELPSFHRRVVLLARAPMASSLDVSADSSEFDAGGSRRFVAIVLGDANEEEPMKNVFSTSHTIATLFSDDDFVWSALGCEDDAEFRRQVRDYVTRRMQAKPAFEDDFSRLKTTFRLSKPMAGIVADAKRKLPFWVTDWTDAFRDKHACVRALSTCVWIATTTLVPAISIGLSMQSDSSRRMTYIDFLLSEAFTNLAWSIIGGQSLLILRVTGPTKTYFNIVRYWADALQVDFVAYYSLTGIFAGVFVAVFACVNGAELVLAVNRFTSETFALIISVTFIYSGFNAMSVMRRRIDDEAEFAVYFVCHLATIILASRLRDIRRSVFVRKGVRQVILDLSPLMAVLSITGLSYGFRTRVKRVRLATEGLSVWPTTVDMSTLDVNTIALALVAALFFATQIVLESTICAMLTSRRENKLLKGSSYNYDLMLVGVFTTITAIFGLPPSVPGLPHSVLHAQLLAKSIESKKHGLVRTRVVESTETRFTNFVAHLVTLAFVVFGRDAIGTVPIATLSGFLAYMGLSSLGTNSILARVGFGAIVPSKLLRRVPRSIVRTYTVLQLSFFGAIFGCQMTASVVPAFAAAYPLLIAASIPFSICVIPRLVGDFYAHALTTSTERENLVGLFY